MQRENKKEAVAALHREQILRAGQTLYSEKGFLQTTIEDISKASGYSRRTIYSYFDSKEDILHQIIAQGLILLKNDIEKAVNEEGDFLKQYFSVCGAMKRYVTNCPTSAQTVTRATPQKTTKKSISTDKIFALGTEINNLLADFLRRGISKGIVRKDIVPIKTVYVLWTCIISIQTLVQTKGDFLEKAFCEPREDFSLYAEKQIINSILEVRIYG